MAQMLSTSQVAIGDRVDWWRDQVRRSFGTDHSIVPLGTDPFSFDLAVESTETIRLLDISGSAHEAISGGNQGPPTVMVRLQTQGHITLRAEHREAQVGPDTVTLLPLRSTGNLTFHDSFRHVSFLVSEEAMAAVFPEWSRMALVPLDATQGLTALFADHMRSLAAHPEVLTQSGASVGDFTLGLLGTVLNSKFDGVTPPSSRLRAYHLERAKRYARSHLCDPALDVTMIAGGIGVSVRYLHRLFSDEPVPIMRWVQQQRLACCREMLARDPRRSVCDIAHTLGFSDHAHFTRSFRKAFGLSPSDARNVAVKAS